MKYMLNVEWNNVILDRKSNLLDIRDSKLRVFYLVN